MKPTLPEPDIFYPRNKLTSYSTLAVMRLIDEAYAAGLEEAAKVCDELAELSRESETDSMWQHGECAAAIRALKEGP